MCVYDIKEKITTDLLIGIILILWTHTINDDFMSFQWRPIHFVCLLTYYKLSIIDRSNLIVKEEPYDKIQDLSQR